MPEKEKKLIIDIVPLTRIPLTRNQSFSYLSEKEIPVGSLVSIPLFKRKVEGIVIGARDDFHRLGKIELKKVDKIIEESFLTEEQLKLAKHISDYYISPLGVVMKNFVPKRVKLKANLSASNLEPSPVSIRMETSSPEGRGGRIILTKEQQKAVSQITNYQLPASPAGRLITNYLLFGPAASGKTEVYIHSIIKIREKNPDAQFLILVPEQTLTPQAIERYSAYFKPEEIVLMTSNINKGQYYSNWLRIKSGEAKIIIGTRMAVFAPFKRLGLIAIDEEQDMSYKQWDMNPRYDARTAAEKLAKMHICPIVFGSATPRIESYYKAKNKEYILSTLPRLNIPNTKYQILNTIIVDMKKERWEKNYTTISKKLKSEIAYALKNKQQVILFINRQGMSSFSICAKCKTVLKCPQCERALVYDNKKIYRCTHCSYKTSELPECPVCRSWEFKNIGLGTQKVEREIIDLFPSAKVARIDSQVVRNNKMHEKIYNDFSRGNIDILVGTQMISKGWDLPNVSLIGIIDMDNMLSIPDFSAQERAFGHVIQVSGRVNRPGARFPGVVVVQTFQPENKTIKKIISLNYENFYNEELKERQVLKLPPLGKLIKLTCQDYSDRKITAESRAIYDIIAKISDIDVTEPHPAYVHKIRGRYRRQMVIKYKKEIPVRLRRILERLSNKWIIDIDPISLI